MKSAPSLSKRSFPSSGEPSAKKQKLLNEEEFICIEAQKERERGTFYEEELMCHLKQRQRVVLNYMDSEKTSCTSLQRMTLIDWLAEIVHNPDEPMTSQTLHLAKELLDKSLEVSNPTDLQLLGLVVLSIAAKLEEYYVPALATLAEEIGIESEVFRSEEQAVLKQLNYNVAVTTQYPFLMKYLSDASTTHAHCKEELTLLCQYMSEVSLLYYPLVFYKPSIIALSVVHTALQTMKIPVSDGLVSYAREMSHPEFKTCCETLRKCFLDQQILGFTSSKIKYGIVNTNFFKD